MKPGVNSLNWRRVSRLRWPRGALLIAKEEYPDLERRPVHEPIGRTGAEAERWVNVGANTIERVQNLSQFLFEHHRFAGNRNSYGDPRNSFLNEVLERKLGIPDLALGSLYRGGPPRGAQA